MIVGAAAGRPRGGFLVTAPPPVGLAPEASGARAPEPALVARALLGDREASNEIHARFAPVVNAVVLAHARAQDAADLVQEVFARALAELSRLRNPERLGAWLCEIARNVAIDRLRRRRATVDLPDDLADRATETRADEASAILATIRTVPETYREALLMRLVEGLTGPEIAERTGLTHGSVRVHLHRGMQHLRDALARRGITP
ncbi:MAG TPA: sigma-70 family RNA polymerase sigma factor [Planctomycetota bacterium]|nr:sigma-70 family RNA polymerase sigma factor [Planctomycetota bacterium]